MEGETDGIKKGGQMEKNREQMEEATKGRKKGEQAEASSRYNRYTISVR